MAKKIIWGLIMAVLAAGLVFAQEEAPDVIVLKTGEEIEAVIQEIGLDTVRYARASNPNGPAYTVRKSDVFMIRYANGDRDVFTDTQRPASGGSGGSSAGGFGGSSTGDYKLHRFGAFLDLGGLKSETDTDSLFTVGFGGSYSYMFRNNIGWTFNLRPFFGGHEKSGLKQNDSGFQALAGIRYIFPVVYTTAGGKQINPFAAAKIGIGGLTVKNTLKIESGSGDYKSTTTTETKIKGSGFAFELEAGVEMDSHFYIAFVYNFQGGKLDGTTTMTVSLMGNENSIDTPASGESKGNFIGVRVGYQF
jgi:hypothetical protein